MIKPFSKQQSILKCANTSILCSAKFCWHLQSWSDSYLMYPGEGDVVEDELQQLGETQPVLAAHAEAGDGVAVQRRLAQAAARPLCDAWRWRDVTRCHAGKLHFSLGMNTGEAIIGDNTQAEVRGPTCLVKALIFSGFLTVSYIKFFRITGTLDGPSFRKYLLSHCTSPLGSLHLHHWLLLKVHLGLGGQMAGLRRLY